MASEQSASKAFAAIGYVTATRELLIMAVWFLGSQTSIAPFQKTGIPFLQQDALAK